MRIFIWFVLVLALLGAGGGVAYWLTRPTSEPTELVLYGNVDLRQVQLAFNNSERVITVKYQEGDRVRKGEWMAKLDRSRLEPMFLQADAQVAAQNEVFKKLKAGNRPQEIAQARANVLSAEADAANARRQFQRVKKLATVRLSDLKEVRAVSQEDVDNAKAALDVADAKLIVQQKALDLAVLGPHVEEIGEAEFKLRANQAQLDYLREQLKDTTLYAPCNAIVRTRLMEVGEMATPQKAVYSLAVVDPKWVRAYVAEPDLGKVRYGMTAYVTVDSFPDKQFTGWVGFRSSVAEFTPKTVQTVELRTSLVYEVRVFVNDPNEELCLGMPATIHLPLK